jgi:PAS domain S-box-containing protein
VERLFVPILDIQQNVSGPVGALADRAQSDLAALAVQRSRMPMVVTDPTRSDNPIILANDAFLKMTGYASEEVIGRNCRFLQGPATSRDALARVRAAVAAQEEICLEVLNYRKDGSTFWNQLTLSPIHDDDGVLIHYFGSQMDVTEKRRLHELEHAERRLLKEVDHRAMNALALVQGIVRLTRAPSTAAYASAVQGRVQVLAQAHALLAAQGWSEVPLAELVEAVIGGHRAGRVEYGGPSLMLSAKQVQPMAIILHELVSNAELHGALAAASGRLTLAWNRDPATGDLTLRWAEISGPPPSETRNAGYGFTMTDAILKRQMKGSIDRAWLPTGLVASIRLPRAD